MGDSAKLSVANPAPAPYRNCSEPGGHAACPGCADACVTLPVIASEPCQKTRAHPAGFNAARTIGAIAHADDVNQRRCGDGPEMLRERVSPADVQRNAGRVEQRQQALCEAWCGAVGADAPDGVVADHHDPIRRGVAQLRLRWPKRALVRLVETEAKQVSRLKPCPLLGARLGRVVQRIEVKQTAACPSAQTPSRVRHRQGHTC